LIRRLCAAPLFLRALKEFPSTEFGQTNPIFCSHFHVLLISVIEGDSNQLRTTFAGFLPVIVNRIQLGGYQSILRILIRDHLEGIAFPHQPIDAFRFMGARSFAFAQSYIRTSDIVFCRRIHALFTVLREFFSDRENGALSPFARDLEFVRGVVHATFHAPLDNEMYVAFREGIRLVAELVRRLQPGDPVKKFVKPFAIAFCDRYNVRTYDWQGTELRAEQRMLVDAFSVLWQGGIDHMFPLFFADPPVSGEFNRTLLRAVAGWKAPRFLTWMHRNQILERIVAAAADQARARHLAATNPQVWQLAQFVAFGYYKRLKDGQKPKTYKVPDEFREEYDRFSSFVVARLLPYLNLVENEKAKCHT
jgi:hypothetical protein